MLYDKNGRKIGTFTAHLDGGPLAPSCRRRPLPCLFAARGFGKVWREQPGVRDALGWAYWPETPVSSMTQARSTGGDWKAIDYYFKIVDAEELVVDLVVVLHLRRLDKGAQQARATVRRGLFEVGVAALHVLAEQLGGPFGLA